MSHNMSHKMSHNMSHKMSHNMSHINTYSYIENQTNLKHITDVDFFNYKELKNLTVTDCGLLFISDKAFQNNLKLQYVTADCRQPPSDQVTKPQKPYHNSSRSSDVRCVRTSAGAGSPDIKEFN
ncbi:high affinity nerve growth factor receptor [Tachysurus ichikawai]